MRNKNSAFQVILVLSIICGVFFSFMLTNASAIEEYNKFEDSFPLQTYDSRFYVIHLDDSEEIDISVTPSYRGDFDLFVFNIRPNNTYVLGEAGYDSIIFNLAADYDISRDSDSFIHFKALDSTQFGSKLYYIQVVLYANGTDTFHITINSTTDFALDTYFIPFIPGYQTELIMGIPLIVLGIIYLKSKKKIKILN